MDTDTCSVYELFEQSKRHVVPLYQRAYIWNETEQWDPLWEDVWEKAEAILEQRKTSAHFLGAIVRSQVAAPGMKLDARLVIDGQQRLTTFQVLLAAIRDLVHEHHAAAPEGDDRENLEDLKTEFEKITTNTGRVRSDDERLKVWPTNADRDAFSKVMLAGSRRSLDEAFVPIFSGKKKVRQKDPRLLVEAYRFFSGELSEELKRRADKGVAAVAVFDALLQCMKDLLQLVVIDLDPADDPQVIFETLNFRGAPLLASDLVKNFIFGKALAQSLDPERTYEQHWHHFDDESADEAKSFWKRKIKQGRFTRPIFDLFLEHFLMCKNAGDFFLSRHLYQEFKDWWDKEKPQVLDVVRDIERQSRVYRTFHEPSTAKTPRLALFLSRLRLLDTTTVYPLLLHILVDTPTLTDAERDGMFADLESFLVRRWIKGDTTKNYNRYFGAILKEMARGSEPPSRAWLRARLSSGGGVAAWPTDEQFEAAWLREPAFDRFNSPGVQMVLRAIEDAMLTSKQERVVIASPLTVEHVMPVDWSTHWSPPAVDDALEEESADERRSRLLQSFGNLTLLTQALNSSVSNGPFPAKRDGIRASLLNLNHYFDGLQSWDEKAIVERGRVLFGYAKKVWPGPTSAP